MKTIILFLLLPQISFAHDSFNLHESGSAETVYDLCVPKKKKIYRTRCPALKCRIDYTWNVTGVTYISLSEGQSRFDETNLYEQMPKESASQSRSDYNAVLLALIDQGMCPVNSARAPY